MLPPRGELGLMATVGDNSIMVDSLFTPLEVISACPRHDRTLPGILASRIAAAPDRPFLVFGDRRWTYAEFGTTVEHAASMFRERGVQPGDRIGVVSPNHPATVVALFALARLGAIMVPVNPDYGVEEAQYVLSNAAVSGVICAAATLATVREACGGIEPAPWFMLNEPARGDIGTDGGIRVFDAAIARAAGPAPRPVAEPGGTCLLIYTSGTTGFPKGVMHSQRNLVLAGEGFVERMLLQPSERVLCILPLFHINALHYSLFGAVAAGATFILAPRFSASTFWKTVADTGATEVNTIAAVTSILLRRPRSEFVPGHALRKVYGAPLTPETLEVFGKEFGVPHLIEGYGMSEIPGVLNNPFRGPHRVGSMGRLSRHPDPAIELATARIVDDDGNVVPEGETGELEVRTPIVMQGYFRDPEQTAAAFHDGWFRTGDLVWRDAEGFHWFVARRKDIIRKRGENISGAELDRIIALHPEVLEAAAIAVPAELGEDEILVVVVRRSGATVTARGIADWCRSRLAPVKVPRYVAFVEDLPHTPTHRVAKFKLKADATLKARAEDLGE